MNQHNLSQMEFLRGLTSFHRARCVEYRNYIDNLFPTADEAQVLAEIPWVPVRAFKEFRLKSIPDDHVYKVMTSSGTTGTPSVIYLDRETAKLQQNMLIDVFAQSFGQGRYPMLVIDAEKSVRLRSEFSARTAAINGFSLFARRRAFALKDDMSIDYEGIEDFLQKHADEKIFIFGFTFVIWSFLKELKAQKRSIDVANSFVLHGGGWKKLEKEKVSNEDYSRLVADLTGCRIVRNYYGMIEQTGSIYIECPNGHLHAPTGANVITRRPSDLTPCEYGEQGLIQVFSEIQKSYPGHSLLTEDLGYVLPSSDCDCGNPGIILKVLGRATEAEIRGCSDAVTF